jgi:hypothetical protein
LCRHMKRVNDFFSLRRWSSLTRRRNMTTRVSGLFSAQAINRPVSPFSASSLLTGPTSAFGRNQHEDT